MNCKLIIQHSLKSPISCRFEIKIFVVKELLQQYSAYNAWANQRLVECIQSHPEDIINRAVPSSFPTIYATLLHMWDAESIWWQRLKLQEVVIPPSAKFEGSVRDVAAALLHQNNLWKNWIDQASAAAIDHVFHYQNTKREQFRQPVYQVLLHMFNHGTYHRGQLVTMLRQLGIDRIPGTDFIIWSRTRK
jgi:uncharacterized damage-inducible protein DinB